MQVSLLMKRLACFAITVILSLFFFACGKKGDPFLPLQVTPKPVRQLLAVVRPEHVVLLWKAPGENTDGSPLLDLAGFKVFREEVPFEEACKNCPRNFIRIFDYDYKGPRGKVPEKKWLFYFDRDLELKTLNTYKINCYNEKGVLGPESKFVRVNLDVPPAAPSGIRAEIEQRAVKVQWDPLLVPEDQIPAEEIEGFNLYRTMKQGEYENRPLNESIIKGTAYEDIPEKYDATYFYTVRALRRKEDTLIEGYPSEEIEVSYRDVTSPGVPRALTAVPQAEGMLLKWAAVTEEDIAGFILYRKEPGQESFTRLNKKFVIRNSWIDETAEVRKRYIYGVTSVDGSARGNESALSETVEVLYILK